MQVFGGRPTTRTWCPPLGEVGEDERCRAVYNLAVDHDEIERPECGKAFIDFEIAQGEVLRLMPTLLLEQIARESVAIAGRFEEDARTGFTRGGGRTSRQQTRCEKCMSVAPQPPRRRTTRAGQCCREWLKYERGLGRCRGHWTWAAATVSGQEETRGHRWRWRLGRVLRVHFPQDQKKDTGNMRIWRWRPSGKQRWPNERRIRQRGRRAPDDVGAPRRGSKE